MKKEPRNSRSKYKIKLHSGSDEDRTEKCRNKFLKWLTSLKERTFMMTSASVYYRVVKKKKHMWETLKSTEETEKEVMSGRNVTGGKMREWNQQNWQLFLRKR